MPWIRREGVLQGCSRRTIAHQPPTNARRKKKHQKANDLAREAGNCNHPSDRPYVGTAGTPISVVDRWEFLSTPCWAARYLWKTWLAPSRVKV
jgi:hypothetical protein